MMRIDSVSANPDRVGKYKVCFGDGTKMYLYRQTIEDHSIYTGRELTDEELSLLREAAGEMSAKMRAVRILAASNVSRADLKQRLISKGETKENAVQAVAWMEDLALVDDKKTAQEKLFLILMIKEINQENHTLENKKLWIHLESSLFSYFFGGFYFLHSLLPAFFNYLIKKKTGTKKQLIKQELQS